MNIKRSRLLAGFSLIDLVISMGIIVLLFGGIFLVYSSIIDSTKSNSIRTAAFAVLGQQEEIIRNMPYDQVGTQGGIPSGIIPQTQTIAAGDVTFIVTTSIRNIDDPFDGTLGGNPNDTAPADYKLVEISAQCIRCSHPLSYRMTTNVAPDNLESANSNGSLVIDVLDANGTSVSNADIHVVNASVTPAIDLTDTTNASGVLRLVGVPTSTQAYAITVTKSGYSSDKTYKPGDPSNPNPTKPHATVATGAATEVSFAVDKTSVVNVLTSGVTCIPSGNKSFSISGSKLIGTNPSVLKFGTSSATDGNGLKTFSALEWDSYTFKLNSSSSNFAGTVPLSPAAINPGSSYDFRFVTKPASPLSLLVTVRDSATGAGISSSSVNLTKGAFSATLITGRSTWIDTDWSGGGYSDQDGGVEADSPAGSLTLKLADGAYSTTTVSWLISKTIDVGSSTAAYYAFSWNPATQPAQAGADSVRFQIASNNDQATWNFIGPDGTANTYYAASGATLSGLHTNNRYLRYKIFLKTQDENVTPEVQNVQLDFYSVCVPPAQVFFTGLNSGTYTIDVAAPGYVEATSSVSVVSSWQQADIQLSQ